MAAKIDSKVTKCEPVPKLDGHIAMGAVVLEPALSAGAKHPAKAVGPHELISKELVIFNSGNNATAWGICTASSAAPKIIAIVLALIPCTNPPLPGSDPYCIIIVREC